MLVAPYSPSARAKESTVPARMPCRQAGIRMRQKIYRLDSPSVCPAWASVSSKLSKAPRAVRYIRGKATTTVAKMADHQVMTSFVPNSDSTSCPTGRRGPSTRSSRYPTTVGGSTRGRVRITSRTPLTSRGSRAIAKAAQMPRKKRITVDMPAIRREFHRGNQSIAASGKKGSALRCSPIVCT